MARKQSMIIPMHRWLQKAGAAKNIIDDLDEVFTLKDDKLSTGSTLDTFDLIGIGENSSAANQRLIFKW